MSRGRVRLYGGRPVHKVQPLDEGLGYFTVCSIFLTAEARNNWLPDSTKVTCTRCINKEKRRGRKA